jgi:hypothetical protein
LGYINTFLKEGAPYYLEAKKKGFLVRSKCGHPLLDEVDDLQRRHPRSDQPEAYEWYKALIKDNMIGLGLSGWMADFGEYLPTDAVVYGGIPEKLHNRWPSMWAKCCHEAVVESGKENEIFFFSRAAYGHTIQYTNSMWNGDQHVDYSDEYGLGSVIPASLSMSYSGVGVVHSDIGGYTTILHMKRSAELFNRWSELELFFPVYRTHEGNRPKENVQFDDPRCLKEFARNSQIFAALKPYRLYLLEEYETKGYPFIRPLSFDEKEVDPSINQREFLMGDEVLVSPVLRGNESEHQVYLPAGEWVQLFTGKAFDGGTFKIPSPPGLPVAFYKKGCRFAELFESLKDFLKENKTMKYFLDSAKLDEIDYAYKSYAIDGVTTNPKHIMASGKPFMQAITDIAEWIKANHLEGMDKFPVSVEVNPHLEKKEEMVEMAKEGRENLAQLRHQDSLHTRRFKGRAGTRTSGHPHQRHPRLQHLASDSSGPDQGQVRFALRWLERSGSAKTRTNTSSKSAKSIKRKPIRPRSSSRPYGRASRSQKPPKWAPTSSPVASPSTKTRSNILSPIMV